MSKNKFPFVLSISGFTILELLIVFSIVASLSGIGLASFVSYSRTQTVEASVSEFKTAVEKAKFNTVSRVKPPSPAVCDALHSYKLEIGPGLCSAGYNYCLKVICGPNVPETEIEIYDGKLPNSVAFTNIGCSSVIFTNLSNSVVCEAGHGSIPADIEMTGFGNIIKTVRIDSAGNAIIQ